MADVMVNLIIYLALISVFCGGGYALWRRITGGP
jgi:hypothetical protein